MNSLYDAAVLGVGSSHGDDSIGWHVVDELSRQCPEKRSGANGRNGPPGASHHWCLTPFPNLYLRKLPSPSEIIDYLASAREVHVVDAAIGIGENDSVGCFRYSVESERDAIESVSTASTHGIGVGHTLRLAESLRLPTDHVTIWFARGVSFESMAAPSATAIESARQCTKEILQELCNARTITR